MISDYCNLQGSAILSLIHMSCFLLLLSECVEKVKAYLFKAIRRGNAHPSLIFAV